MTITYFDDLTHIYSIMLSLTREKKITAYLSLHHSLVMVAWVIIEKWLKFNLKGGFNNAEQFKFFISQKSILWRG